MVSSAGFSALGTGVRVLATEPGALPAAVAAVRRELAAIDAACSRFRDDSELTRLNRRAGEPVQVSPLLFAALEAAVRACRMTGGHELDLGATAKALAADRAALAAHAAVGCGVLVAIGGDLRVAGESPPDGWPVLVTDDHAAPLDGPGEVISLRSGALATSSTTVRRW